MKEQSSKISQMEEMMKEEKEVRRSFLKRMLAGSAVVATSIAAIKPAKANPQAPVLSEGDEVLYKESKAFKKYYETL
jgi:hypothetical protein